MRSSVLLSSVVIVAGSVTPAAAQVSRGPYLQDARLQAIDVVWEGTVPDPRVGYGVVTPDEAFVDATCAGAHCWATLTGLEPDTAYVYAVYSGGTAASPEGELHTAPAVRRPFSFAVYGDNRSDDASHSVVIESLLNRGGFELVVNTGDMVSSGEIEAQWDTFFAIEAELLRDIPVYPAVGNHEEDDGKARIMERLFHTPHVASSSPEPLYYSFRYSNSHFVAIDGEVNVLEWYWCLLLGKAYDGCLDTDQQAWLEADLARAAADPWVEHVFVFMHKGPYSSKKGRTGSQVIRDLLPLFAESKVKLVISGHDHYYEHGVAGNGLHYMISGGGGAPLYETEPDFLHGLWPHEILVSRSVHNYQIIDVTGSLITVTSYDPNDGSVVEQFTIGTPPACVTAPDCIGEEEGVCEGQWSCVDLTCIWDCAPPPPCEDVGDCPEPPDDVCPGHWECPLPALTCQWACDTIDECGAHEDCSGLDPLNACAGGHYECETGVCEWVCEGPVPVDEGPDEAEAAPVEEVEAADGADEADAGPAVEPDTTSSSGDDTGLAPDVQTPTEDPATMGSSGSDDGCASAAGCSGWLLALLAVARAVRRRRYVISPGA